MVKRPVSERDCERVTLRYARWEKGRLCGYQPTAHPPTTIQCGSLGRFDWMVGKFRGGRRCAAANWFLQGWRRDWSAAMMGYRARIHHLI